MFSKLVMKSHNTKLKFLIKKIPSLFYLIKFHSFNLTKMITYSFLDYKSKLAETLPIS